MKKFVDQNGKVFERVSRWIDEAKSMECDVHSYIRYMLNDGQYE